MTARRVLRGLVPPLAGLVAAIAAFALWNGPLPALVVGILAAGAVGGAMELARREVTWAEATGALVAAALAIGLTAMAWAETGSTLIALVVLVVAGPALGVLLALVTWLVRPYPVDVDSVLGVGPADVLWRYRNAPRWQRFSSWVKARGTGPVATRDAMATDRGPGGGRR